MVLCSCIAMKPHPTRLHLFIATIYMYMYMTEASAWVVCSSKVMEHHAKSCNVMQSHAMSCNVCKVSRQVESHTCLVNFTLLQTDTKYSMFCFTVTKVEKFPYLFSNLYWNLACLCNEARCKSQVGLWQFNMPLSKIHAKLFLISGRFI